MILCFLFFTHPLTIQSHYDDCEIFFDAARTGDTATIQMLLDQKIDIDTQDDEGWTALMHAAFFGKIEIMQLLLECGACVDMQDKTGITALMYAIMENKIEVPGYCMDRVTNIPYFLPMILSRKYNETEMIELLIEHGAQINIQNNLKKTALIIAQSQGQTTVVKLLKTFGAKEWYEFWK